MFEGVYGSAEAVLFRNKPERRMTVEQGGVLLDRMLVSATFSSQECEERSGREKRHPRSLQIDDRMAQTEWWLTIA
jgi:hypothetical protein